MSHIVTLSGFPAAPELFGVVRGDLLGPFWEVTAFQDLTLIIWGPNFVQNKQRTRLIRYGHKRSARPPTMTMAPSSSLNPTSALRVFVLLSSIKWLLVPAYRSTDFDVHRNWLAVTHHLPLARWYFDDVNGTTVHTLDYPPLFAFFEAALSNNALTASLLDRGWLDARCLARLPDAEAAAASARCVRFQRATVVASDAVLFAGAYLAARAVAPGRDGRGSPWLTFLLVVTNPGLIMLDHVREWSLFVVASPRQTWTLPSEQRAHPYALRTPASDFQYNGMLLGVLLISIAALARGAAPGRSHRWELLGAAAFAALLALKHLYLILAPLYFAYLLRRHCFVAHRFSWPRLAVLAVVTATCLAGPFLPFLLQEDPGGQLLQIATRLFPFGRGVRSSASAASALPSSWPPPLTPAVGACRASWYTTTGPPTSGRSTCARAGRRSSRSGGRPFPRPSGGRRRPSCPSRSRRRPPRPRASPSACGPASRGRGPRPGPGPGTGRRATPRRPSSAPR